MPDQINVTGLVQVKVAIPSDGTLVKVGESIDMTDVQEREFWHNVPGDRNGGPQGPPIEIQWLGSIIIVQVDCSRWDPAVVDNLRLRRVRTVGGTNVQANVGRLMLESNSIRLLLHSTVRPINFPCALVREPIAYAMGTKFSQMNLQFECHTAPEGHPNVGVIWNSNTE